MGKGKHEDTSVVFDANSRKKFLLGNMHAKETRRKNAVKKAEQVLREERRERSKIKKEKNEEFAQELMKKQEKLGITPLNILKMNTSMNIPTIEVIAEKQTEEGEKGEE